jgi:hypothetical protein
VQQEDEFESYAQTPSIENRVVEELEQSYARSKSPTLPTINSSVDDEDTDDALAYFSKLAES